MNFNKEIYIEGKLISDTSSTFVIAEAGVNHGGDMKIAKQLIDLASEAGADAVKFQYFKAEHVVLKNTIKAPYQQKTTDPSESQFDMLKKLEVSKEQNLKLKSYCEKNNIIFLTTPGDIFSIDEMDVLNLPAYKVASSDLTNLPFLKKIAKKRKPIFLSTGMSYFSEVQMALETIYEYNSDVVLLQCTANYPIRDDEANLSVISTFKNNFDILVGYSDHTVGIGAAAFAIPMGAKVVEKHFTLDKSLEGPDHKASLSPAELKEFVRIVRKVDAFMGTTIKKPNLSEVYTRKAMQRNMVALRNLNTGDIITEDVIIAKRTNGLGLSPIYYKEIIGRQLIKDIKSDHIFDIKDFKEL
jgi:N,N'-diacetyllegionaminate synthase